MTFTGRKDHGRNHSYYLDCDCTKPGAAGCTHRLTGVTTILDALPKRALIRWAATCAADEAIDHWDELAQLALMERHARLVNAPNNINKEAKVKGTDVHKLAEQLARGEQIDVPEPLTGYVDACVSFLDDWAADIICSETPVLSRKWRYGGTLDLVADLADRQRWLLDWKSSRKGPYGETAFQLAAYRYAETWQSFDHELSQWNETAPVEVDACGVVWLQPDGKYELHPYTADQYVFRQFLYIQQVAQADKDSQDYRGDTLTPPGSSSD